MAQPQQTQQMGQQLPNPPDQSSDILRALAIKGQQCYIKEQEAIEAQRKKEQEIADLLLENQKRQLQEENKLQDHKERKNCLELARHKALREIIQKEQILIQTSRELEIHEQKLNLEYENLVQKIDEGKAQQEILHQTKEYYMAQLNVEKQTVEKEIKLQKETLEKRILMASSIIKEKEMILDELENKRKLEMKQQEQVNDSLTEYRENIGLKDNILTN